MLGEAFEPLIVSFCCNWCSYAGADLAGVSRLRYPPNLKRKIDRYEALKMLDQLNRFSKQRYLSPLYEGLIYLGLGQNNKAIEQIDKAFMAQEPLLVYLKIDPIFDSLRSESKFKAILKKMHFD